jgi:hypothetical protein
MSGHLRICFAAFVLLAGLWTSPASSNAFADWFNGAPQAATPPASAATAPASAETECLLRPGKSTADGQRWVYRLDGHRKCWFLTAEGTAPAKKPVHLRAAKHRGAAPEENETARRKKAVDARAEILRSAPAETSPPTPRAPEVKVVDATSVPVTGAAALVPPAPIANLATDQLMPDDPTPRQVDVETLLAAAPAAGEAVAASVRPTPGAVPVAEAGDDGLGWTATWIGVLLMALGLVSVLSSSRILRGAVLLHPLK